MLDFLARILRNNTPRRDDWLGQHFNAQVIGTAPHNDGRRIVYRDGDEFATYDCDSLGNVISVSVAQI